MRPFFFDPLLLALLALAFFDFAGAAAGTVVGMGRVCETVGRKVGAGVGGNLGCSVGCGDAVGAAVLLLEPLLLLLDAFFPFFDSILPSVFLPFFEKAVGASVAVGKYVGAGFVVGYDGLTEFEFLLPLSCFDLSPVLPFIFFDDEISPEGAHPSSEA